MHLPVPPQLKQIMINVPVDRKHALISHHAHSKTVRVLKSIKISRAVAVSMEAFKQVFEN